MHLASSLFLALLFSRALGLSLFSSAGFTDQLNPNRRENKTRWCAVGKYEKSKCDLWSVVSNGDVECTVADNTRDCIIKIMVWFFFPFSFPHGACRWRAALLLSAWE